MKCRNCGSGVDGKWRFCPKCGAPLGDDVFGFNDVFKRMQEQIRELSRGVEKDIEAFDISPFFRKPIKSKRVGFTIKITHAGNKPPRVDVKRFGDVGREGVHEVRQMPGILEEKPKRESPIKRIFSKPPERMEEPNVNVNKTDSGVLVEIELPGVKSRDDIEIKHMENSVEVKALAGGKAYFKIIKKPSMSRLVDKRFEKGKLLLEFS